MLLKSIFKFLTLGGVFLRITRWTFFRVKLVFEYDFEISWSFGPWDPRTMDPLDPCTFGSWDSWT